MLGETMALWMTVTQECFGPAAMLLAFSCACMYRRTGHTARKKTNRRRPVSFLSLYGPWIALGLLAGTVRMEAEEFVTGGCRYRIEKTEGEPVSICGLTAEIADTDYGIRILLRDAEISGEGPEREQKLGDLYCYGMAVPDLELGMRLAVTGRCEVPERARNPGAFDYRLYCLSKGVTGICYADTVEITAVGNAGIWRVREALRQISLILETRLEQITAAEDLGIMKAVLLGNKEDMSPELYDLYRKNGISHVLAISGLHVSVIGMGAWHRFRKAGCSYAAAGVLALILLILFGSIAGFSPSVVRAVFMMALSFAAAVFGRTYDLPSAMCIPAAGLLLWRPYLLTQPSYQLSFLAVGAMFFPGQYLTKAWKLRGTAATLLVSASLQMVTMPAVLAMSGEIPVFGMLLNLAVVPLMTYVLISGLLGVAASVLGVLPGMFFMGGAHVILAFYRFLCTELPVVSGSSLILGSPGIVSCILYYGLVAAGAAAAVRRSRRMLLLWGIGILLLLPWPSAGLTVTFLDVGQGDGIFLEAGGKTMLVDCGSSRDRALGEDVLIPFLKHQGVSRIDTVVVSHADNDHISGIRYLLETPECGIGIDRVVLPAAGKGEAVYRELEELTELRGGSVHYIRAGDRLENCLGNRVEVACLHPFCDSGTDRGSGTGPGEGEDGGGTGPGAGKDRGGDEDRNGHSVVLQVEFGEFRMLLTGDIRTEEEEELCRRGDISAVTVLKAAHHGSSTSTGQAFLDHAEPDVVILSYGQGNAYGHPSQEVTERCLKAGAVLYETAETGAIRIRTGGRRVQIGTWLDRPGGI